MNIENLTGLDSYIIKAAGVGPELIHKCIKFVFFEILISFLVTGKSS